MMNMLITLFKTKFPRHGSCESTKPTKSQESNPHGPFPTPVITGNTEEGSASGTKEEGEGDGGGH